MQSLPHFVFSPLSAIIAALIAALLSYIGLLISKENKVSEFRQAWIDSLREELSKYGASVSLLSQTQLMLDKEKEENEENESYIPISMFEYLKATQPIVEAVLASQLSIRLRINPNDSDPKLKTLNTNLIMTLDDVQRFINASEYDKAANSIRSLHEQAGPILKEEWKRVKKGEPMYNTVKWLAGIIVIAAFLFTFAAVVSIPKANSGGTSTNHSIEQTSPSQLHRHEDAAHVKR